MGYSISTKLCSTCEYWDGARYFNKGLKIVEAKTNDKGVCKSARSMFKGKEKKSNEQCSFWQKWRFLP